MPAIITIRSPTLYVIAELLAYYLIEKFNILRRILARCWGHNGEDEATVDTGNGETDSDDDDSLLFIPTEHFHRQKSRNTVSRLNLNSST